MPRYSLVHAFWSTYCLIKAYSHSHSGRHNIKRRPLGLRLAASGQRPPQVYMYPSRDLVFSPGWQGSRRFMTSSTEVTPAQTVLHLKSEATTHLDRSSPPKTTRDTRHHYSFPAMAHKPSCAPSSPPRYHQLTTIEEGSPPSSPPQGLLPKSPCYSSASSVTELIRDGVLIPDSQPDLGFRLASTHPDIIREEACNQAHLARLEGRQSPSPNTLSPTSSFPRASPPSTFEKDKEDASESPRISTQTSSAASPSPVVAAKLVTPDGPTDIFFSPTHKRVSIGHTWSLSQCLKTLEHSTDSEESAIAMEEFTTIASSILEPSGKRRTSTVSVSERNARAPLEYALARCTIISSQLHELPTTRGTTRGRTEIFSQRIAPGHLLEALERLAMQSGQQASLWQAKTNFLRTSKPILRAIQSSTDVRSSTIATNAGKPSSDRRCHASSKTASRYTGNGIRKHESGSWRTSPTRSRRSNQPLPQTPTRRSSRSSTSPLSPDVEVRFPPDHGR